MTLRLKTVRFAAPVLTTLGDNTLTNIPQFTVYLPEPTKTIRKAWVEVSMDDITTSAGSIGPKTVSLRLGGAGYTSTTNTAVLTSTGENISLQLTRDFTSHFTTNWTGTSMTCDIQVQIDQQTGTTLGQVNVCAILYVTYEYDDTAATQIKTVLIPLNAPTTSLATTKTSYDTFPALDTYLPEASKTYRNMAVVFESNTMAGSTTDFSVSFELGTTGVHTTQLYEQSLSTDRFVRYVWDLTSYGAATNTTHTFNMWSSLSNTMDAPIVYAFVTYEYDESTTTSAMNCLVLPMEMDSPNGTSATDFQRATREVFVQESNPVLQRLSFQMYWQGTLNESGLNARVGTGSFVPYTITGSAVIAGNKCLMVRNDAPTGLTFARGRNTLLFDSYNTSTSARGGNYGGYWILNYTSDKHADGTGSHNHTVLWPMHTMDTGGTEQGKYTVADAPNIPESDYFITALGFDFGIIIRLVTQGLGLKAERLAGEGGLVWERIYADISQYDGELGYVDAWIQARSLFERWQGDEDTTRLPLETARRYYMNTSNAASLFDRLVMYVSYHSITYTVNGSITGSNAGTVTVNLYRVDTGERLKTTTRSGDGAYSFTWYDDTELVFCAAREDDTYVGRSGNGYAS